MFRVSISPAWQVARTGSSDAAPLDTALLLRLLAHIENSGSIAATGRSLGLSYRHVWGLLRDAEQLFGAGLLDKQPGRGTRLSSLARLLLLAEERIRARLTPTLDSLASELEAELRTVLASSRSTLRLFASHGFAVAALVEWMSNSDIALEVRYRNSSEALAALARGECDLAGFHVPLGRFEQQAMQLYTQWLNPEKHSLIHLAVRTQGILVAPGNPRRIRTLQDLQRGDCRFVNRQAGSGTRMLLELMLCEAGVQPGCINGFDSSEFTHAAVAAYIASGMADAGFGIETAARRFALDFIPLAQERYFLAVQTSVLKSTACAELLDVLRSPGFAMRFAELPGYDNAATGLVQTLQDAFPAASP